MVRGVPIASKAMSTPPSVRRRTCLSSRSIPSGSIVSAAPSSRATARRSGLRSMAITRAPATAAHCTRFRPTPPQPMTATTSPTRTRPRFLTAW